MAIAALIGTTVAYTDYFNSITIETLDNRVMIVSKRIFDSMYYKLDPFTAAFKEDCIEYVVNDPMVPIDEKPDWYIDAYAYGFVEEHCGMESICIDNDVIPMSPGSVILRNYQGRLRYMEYEDFVKYYDIPGSEFIEKN